MDKEEYIHQYVTQLFNDRNKDSVSNENVHFYIGDITEAMWQAWDASVFSQWKSVQASLPPKGQCVNVMLGDGRYTNSFIMSDGTWAYNVRPIAWSEIKRPILYHKPMIELKYPGMKTKNIIYTGPIDDLYNGKIPHILSEYHIQQIRCRVQGKDDSCNRPMIIINLETKTAWIEYVDEECSQYDSFYNKFTCDIQEVKRMIEESQESKE
jgi:hypothetical protein